MGIEKKKLKIIELCSGIGCQLRGIQNTPCFEPEVVATSEINKEAVLAYAAIHCGLTNEIVDLFSGYPSLDVMKQELSDLNLGYIPEKDKKFDWFKGGKTHNENVKKYWLACKLSKNMGDISRIEQLPEADVWFISTPCFVEGTLVFTNKGYVPIEKIEVGDYVITHKNRFQKVTKVMINEADSLVKIHCMTSEDIHCTPNHPFYVREKHNKQDHETGKRWREFEDPKWIEAKDLNTNYYFGTAINIVEKIPDWDGYVNGKGVYKNDLKDYMSNKDFWYLIGKYIGDGWLRTDRGIVICANNTELMSLIECLDNLGFGYSVVKERTINKVHIPFKEIGLFCEQFGRGAINKHLTPSVINLPIDLLRSFIEGYISADGYQDNKGNYKISSISRVLLYDVAACIHKVYHRPTSMYFTARSKTTVIEGRVVNQHDTYTLCWKMDTNKQDQAFYEDGYIWSPISDINIEEYNGLVYNISVEEDESYMVQNVICHNCTDISVAGKLKGLNPDDKTRSSLIWQTLILLDKARETNTLPKYMMLENVKNLVGKKFINDFNTFNQLISEYNYNCYYKVINAKDCGVPQNRERVFAIYIRKDIDTGNYEFPIPFDNGLRLKDVLEDEVDEKYYIKTEKAQALIQKLLDDGVIGQEDDVDEAEENKKKQ